ncbi:enhancer of mRNA decapping, partial [Cladochytrium tenue]
GARRFRPENHGNGPPTVVVLAGRHRAGACALGAARNLANHDVDVFLLVLDGGGGGGGKDGDDVFDAQHRAAVRAAGVRLVLDTAGLPSPLVHPIDVVVDAVAGLAGPSHKIRPADVGAVVRWANACKANKLAVDIPTGLHPDTGLPLSPTLPHIRPRWTVALGLPTAGLAPALPTPPAAAPARPCGELFLADIGLPRRAYLEAAAAVAAAQQQQQPPLPSTPFADKFLVAITPAAAPAC